MEKIITLNWVKKFIKNLSGGALHGAQVKSLSNAVFGALFSRRLSITAIGCSLAKKTGRIPKHTIKQVDRLVGCANEAQREMSGEICRKVVGSRQVIMVSLDWTEYDYSDQSMVAINLITKHGRATPLLWSSVKKSKLKNHRTRCEKKILRLLAESLPETTKVTVLADRGFCSTGLFSYITKKLHWDYIIRIKGNIDLYDEKYPWGRKVNAVRLVRGAAARQFRGVFLTKKKYKLNSFTAVWDKAMKEPWYLASSLEHAPEQIVSWFGRRFTCEEHFRDEKDDRFGEGSKETRVKTVERRDMLKLIHAITTIILTIVGASGERIGYDRKLRANTKRNRTHSLYRQGKEYVDGVPRRFIKIFRKTIGAILLEHYRGTEMFGVI